MTEQKSGHYIYVTHYTKNGKTYYARDYGKKAFRFFIEDES